VGDDGDVAKVHGSSSCRAILKRDLAGKPGSYFRVTLKKTEFRGVHRPKKETRP
jgi:hypothetical protein